MNKKEIKSVIPGTQAETWIAAVVLGPFRLLSLLVYGRFE